MNDITNPTIEPKYELIGEPEDGLYRIRAKRCLVLGICN